jgi:Transglutaminase-like superfamily
MSARGSRILTVRAFSMFLILDMGFRLMGFQRIYQLVAHRARRPVDWNPLEAKVQAQKTFQAVQAATMFYYRRRKDCLPKALTTFHLLRRQGISAQICFGVRKFPFAAHTWVEAFGELLDDDPSRLPHFTVIHRAAS